MFLVDGFDLIEERVDGVVEFGVDVEGEAGFGDCCGDATPLVELIGWGVDFSANMGSCRDW